MTLNPPRLIGGTDGAGPASAPLPSLVLRFLYPSTTATSGTSFPAAESVQDSTVQYRTILSLCFTFTRPPLPDPVHSRPLYYLKESIIEPALIPRVSYILEQLKIVIDTYFVILSRLDKSDQFPLS